MTESIAIMWFRNDLRLADNPALRAACNSGKILPIYILEDDDADDCDKIGAASRVWLHHSLQALNHSLDGKLQYFVGKAEDILMKLCHELTIASVHWNRAYEPWRMTRTSKSKSV